MNDEPDRSLDGAYALATPEDNRKLYARWAESYDEDLTRDYDYVYPAAIAALFRAEGGDGPTLDIGCGTGLVAEALARSGAEGPIDGLDISPEMLAAARAKGLYRRLIEADLTAAPLPADGAYRGVLSAGAFTMGALGPDAIAAAAPAAATGALFVIGINAHAFETYGFEAALAAMTKAGAIEPPRFESGAIYGPEASHEHAGDRFVAAIFRKR